MKLASLWTELRRRPLILTASLVLSGFIVLAIVFPFVPGIDPTASNISARLEAPTWAGGDGGLLGTDELGRDLLIRILYGLRTSFTVGIGAALFGAFVGTLLGMVAGYFGGKTDAIIMRLADVQLSFPGLLLVLVIVGALGRGIPILIFLLGFMSWMLFARVIRSAVLSFRTTDLISATHSLGASSIRILVYHILPNIAPALMALVTLRFAQLMLAEASLSFLGFGIQPPEISLGAMLAQGRQVLSTAWWLSTFAGLFLTVGVLSTNLVGSWLHDQLDPLGSAPAAKRKKSPRGERGQQRVAAGQSPLISVRDLSVGFGQGSSRTTPIESVSFDIARGERVALVGESGSGKSLTGLSIMGLIDKVGGHTGESSSVLLDGEDILTMTSSRLQTIRGRRIGMIFQDPLASLNAVQSIGRQATDAHRIHNPGLKKSAYRRHAIDLLEQVKLPNPSRVFRAYPHELSGGMRQRAMIAIALACDPDLLIADEPTTALDVTVQAGVLDLMHDLSSERGMALLLITHDLSVVAGSVDRVVVMYGGRILETSPTGPLFDRPKHPYTMALMSSIPSPLVTSRRLATIPGSPPEPEHRPIGCLFGPRCTYFMPGLCDTERPPLRVLGDMVGHQIACACVRLDEIGAGDPQSKKTEVVDPRSGEKAEARNVMLAVEGVSKTFSAGGLASRAKEVQAVRDVTLDVYSSEILGIVGESGSGKTTLARIMGRLIEPTRGDVTLLGQDLLQMNHRQLRKVRRDVQMIFQDPGSSLDPRMTLSRILAEPLRIHGLWGQDGYDDARLKEILRLVHLPVDAMNRYARQFSGGQQQRIAIARALTLNPRLLICDEPVSALDVSVRASIVNLLAELRDQLGLTIVFVAHDLSLVRFLCDRIGVMYQGELVEFDTTARIFANPTHEHTNQLLLSQPAPDPEHERRSRAERQRLAAESARVPASWRRP